MTSAVRQIISRLLVALLLISVLLEARAAEPDIVIDGLDSEQQANVRSFLSLTKESCSAPAWKIKHLFNDADQEITRALSALGYYHPTTAKKLAFPDDCWQAEFNIDSGQPVIISNIKVKISGEAEQEPAFKKYLASLPLHTGDVLNHGLYEKIKQDLHSLSLEKGYLDNQFTSKELRVYTDKNQAEIELVFASGPRYRFGHIQINQDILNPEFLQRFITFSDGEYYSSKKLANTYTALADSLYFRQIDINTQILSSDKQTTVPVAINLTPNKTHDFNFGVGYDTDIGPLGSFGYQNRRLNRDGHRLSFNLAVSPLLSSVDTTYTLPFAQSLNDNLVIGLGYKFENPDTFEAETAKLSFQYQHFYPNGWKQILFLNLSTEDYRIGDDKRHSTLMVPGGRWQYAQANQVLRPTEGYTLDFSLAAAPEEIISDVLFVQTQLIAKLITPLPWNARVIARTNLGATLTDNFEQLPATYHFYAGSLETIRGYRYKQLGPTDADNNVIGGKFLAVVSGEYEHFINDAWSVATFFDAGNAFNPDDIQIKSAVGLGLRWLSPIGPLRLDFAFPLDDAKDSFQFYFSAGDLFH